MIVAIKPPHGRNRWYCGRGFEIAKARCERQRLPLCGWCWLQSSQSRPLSSGQNGRPPEPLVPLRASSKAISWFSLPRTLSSCHVGPGAPAGDSSSVLLTYSRSPDSRASFARRRLKGRRVKHLSHYSVLLLAPRLPASVSRIGQSRADDPLHFTANWLRTRSSFLKSRIFARTSATCRSVKALTWAQVRL